MPKMTRDNMRDNMRDNELSRLLAESFSPLLVLIEETMLFDHSPEEMQRLEDDARSDRQLVIMREALEIVIRKYGACASIMLCCSEEELSELRKMLII